MCVYTCLNRFPMKKWHLWLGPDPKICCPQSGHLGKPLVSFWSKSEDLRSRGARCVNPSSRIGEDPCSSSVGQAGRKRGQIPLFSIFWFYSRSQQIGWRPLTLWRPIYFSESTDSDANLIWKHLHRPNQK